MNKSDLAMQEAIRLGMKVGAAVGFIVGLLVSSWAVFLLAYWAI